MAAINHNGNNGSGNEVNYIVHKHDINMPESSLMGTAENAAQFELKNDEETLTGDDLNSSNKKSKKKAVEFTKANDNGKAKRMAGIPTNINV